MRKFHIVAILVSYCFIISCKESEIQIKERSMQEMNMLFSQIKKISEQTPCEIAADWKYVEYGNQTCGGHIGFLYYSTKIDTVSFLKLVDDFTAKQKEFNIRWPESPMLCIDYLVPARITCENGKPKGHLN